LPPLLRVLTTGSGESVWGFGSAGDEAVGWWRRLRADPAMAGWWPLLIEDETAEFLVERAGSGPDPEPEPPLDGAAVLAARPTQLPHAADVDRAEMLASFADLIAQDPSAVEFAEEVVAHACDGRWPADPPRPGFRIPYRLDGTPAPVTVILLPVAEGWQVHQWLGYGSWNEYPAPAEHGAILRYWNQRWGADLVGLTAATAEFAVARPPTTRADALALAGEWSAYNDGASDNYRAANLTQLAASLLGAPVWLAWWD
jgi:hypothetical protein